MTFRKEKFGRVFWGVLFGQFVREKVCESERKKKEIVGAIGHEMEKRGKERVTFILFTQNPKYKSITLQGSFINIVNAAQ